MSWQENTGMNLNTAAMNSHDNRDNSECDAKSHVLQDQGQNQAERDSNSISYPKDPLPGAAADHESQDEEQGRKFDFRPNEGEQ
jgi:hypothetical protein